MATSPNLAECHNITFHQHGDIAFCELPTEGDKSGRHIVKVSQGGITLVQGEHSLGLMKFIRKASEAVTSGREDAACPTGSKSDSARRKSFGLSATTGFVYCGEEQPPTPEPPKEPIKSKRLSIFRNVSCCIFNKSPEQERQGQGAG